VFILSGIMLQKKFLKLNLQFLVGLFERFFQRVVLKAISEFFNELIFAFYLFFLFLAEQDDFFDSLPLHFDSEEAAFFKFELAGAHGGELGEDVLF
jgi:hypothetical protein